MNSKDLFNKLKDIDSRFFIFIPIITIPTFWFKEIMIIASLIAVTILISYFSQKIKLKKFGIELVTFTTIITGVAFGALPGAIIGVSLITIHDIMTKRIGSYWIVVIPMFGLIGAMASLYSHINIIILGIGLTLFSHFVFLMYQKIVFQSPSKYLPYVSMNILLNALLFYKIAPIIISTL